ncbi:hypothetical protein D7X87_07325 [bacterium D16-54]|nr:hypothetical protein D7X87_07325 [bacterium D16-54]RKJ15520.1 hypothetical protein D7X65_07315 [bacterium D16-56]
MPYEYSFHCGFDPIFYFFGVYFPCEIGRLRYGRAALLPELAADVIINQVREGQEGIKIEQTDFLHNHYCSQGILLSF